MQSLTDLPVLGAGLSARPAIHSLLLEHRAEIDWLEIITEEFMYAPRKHEGLLALREAFPLVPHGIELSIGAEEEPDSHYIDGLAALVAEIQAPWFSDHLCFTRADGIPLNILVPVLRTRENARRIGRKAASIQRWVGVPFLLENVSTYLDIPAELTEAEFITEVLDHFDGGLLLDLTNVYNNSVNNHFDPMELIDQLPLERVVQLHLAGGTWAEGFLQDNHWADVHPPVWDMLRYVLPRTSVKGMLIERDGKFPDAFPAVLADLRTARSCAENHLRVGSGQ
jgi:uncharacterized protein (UPF0276 family)